MIWKHLDEQHGVRELRPVRAMPFKLLTVFLHSLPQSSEWKLIKFHLLAEAEYSSVTLDSIFCQSTQCTSL
jgi:hypothetical protein